MTSGTQVFGVFHNFKSYLVLHALIRRWSFSFWRCDRMLNEIYKKIYCAFIISMNSYARSFCIYVINVKSKPHRNESTRNVDRVKKHKKKRATTHRNKKTRKHRMTTNENRYARWAPQLEPQLSNLALSSQCIYLNIKILKNKRCRISVDCYMNWDLVFMLSSCRF